MAAQTAREVVQEGVATLQAKNGGKRAKAVRELLALLDDSNKLRLFDELGESFMWLALGESPSVDKPEKPAKAPKATPTPTEVSRF